MWDSEATKEAAEQQPSTSTRRLSDTLGPSKSTTLTAEQARRRVKFCHKLLQLPKDRRFIKRIVTCDEKWNYINNRDLQKKWLDKGQLPVPVAKREGFEEKVLLCVWWNYEGLIYYELVPDGRTINAEVYSQQLEKMYTVLLEKYPALVNRKRVLLQQDNARPHTAKKILKKLEELEGIELLPRPALLLILSHQTTICFVLWPSSFVAKSFSL
jgi:histone-lysine N-methyltransferase SETMAR